MFAGYCPKSCLFINLQKNSMEKDRFRIWLDIACGMSSANFARRRELQLKNQFTLKQSFIQGTMILLAAGIVNRLLGFVPRITLPRVVGAEGIGLYQMGFPFLIVVLTVITGGLPLAVAKLVAEAESERNERRIRTILRTAMTISIGIGSAFTVVCLLASPWITSKLLTDSRVYFTFLCMTPIIPLVSVSAVLRGYFQGRHNMIPTAVSQTVETLVRIVGMLLFAFMLLPYGVEFAAAGAMLGVLAGELCGMLVLLLQHKASRSQYDAFQAADIGAHGAATRRFHAARRLLRLAIPVTAGKLVGSGSYFLESVMIVQSLAIAGIATSAATAQYGILQGMVIPILLLPSALTYSLAVSLIPSLSDAAARKDMRTIHKLLTQSLRLALVTGAPFAVLMYVLAEPLCYYLYNDSEVGKMLKMMAPVAMFIYLQGPLQAALQALDRPGSALLNTFIGASIKLILIYQLATKPQWGIYGAVMAISANILLVTLLHWSSVSRLLKFRMKNGDFIKVASAMVIMGCFAYFLMYEPWIDSRFVRFLSASLLSSLLYLLLMVWLKLVDRTDLKRVPWLGPRLSKWFG
jgi:stage V sporulation protein B